MDCLSLHIALICGCCAHRELPSSRSPLAQLILAAGMCPSQSQSLAQSSPGSDRMPSPAAAASPPGVRPPVGAIPLLALSVCLLSVCCLCQHQSSVLFQEGDGHARHRRSNIPCGKSFVPCDGSRGEILSGSPALAFGVQNEPSVEKSNDASLSAELETFSTAKKAAMAREVARTVGEKGVQSAVAEARLEVDQQFNATEPRLLQDFRATNFLFSTTAWSELWRIDRHAKAMSHSALVSLAATRSLRRSQLLSGDQIRVALPEMSLHGTELEELCPPSAIAECVPGKFRSYSGHCNNVNEPLWGAAYEPMARLQPPDYANEVDEPRQRSKADAEMPLPSARVVSSRLMGGTREQEQGHSCSLMLAQWAQFLYEDVARAGTNRLFASDARSFASIPMPCCADPHPECLPIITEADDVPFKGRGQCIPYARSVVAPRVNCSLGVREQANLVSAFLDASHVYGNSKAESAELRTFSGGSSHILQTSAQFPRLELPPPAPDTRACSSESGSRPCFLTGSPLTNLLPTGAALHTLWLRQHNRLARELKSVNPLWEDERLFQEARRISIAQMQHITFDEWLPIVVGKSRLREQGLQLRRTSFNSDYNIKTNPSALNEFATAAGLFFFALFPDSIGFADRQGNVAQQRHLSSQFNDPSVLYQHGRLESLIRFLLQQPAGRPSPHLSEELRNKFLRGPDVYGLDLAAMIIQMGRDHGLNGFTAWRQHCGLSRPKGFDQLAEILLPGSAVEEFAAIYAHVDDIDLFVGGLAERPQMGSFLGPTFGCILAKQFEKLRHGDRFWYENFFEPSAFSEAQLAEIRQTTLAAIICDNTEDIGMIQPAAFQTRDDYGNCPINCNTTAVIPRLDLRHWKDQEPHRHLPITRETLEKAVRLGAEQFRRLEEAETGRINRQPVPEQVTSALLTHASIMAPKKESLDIARTAGILRETTKVLLRGDGLSQSERLPAELDLATLQRLLPEVDVSRVVGNFSAFLGDPTGRRECLPKPLPCDHTAKYRTFSGWCNNLRFPHYGNAFEPLRRMQDPAYDDGFDTPRTKGRGGRALPSARRVSNAVHSDRSVVPPRFHVRFSHMVMQFGQIIDHDLTHSPISRGPNNTVLNCSSCDSVQTLSIHCFPIRIESGDPHFPERHDDGTPRCMPFARSLLGQLTLGYRNQINQLTSFLDASYIYGSTDCEANALRLFNRGRMNFTDLGQFNKQALPQGLQERDCRSRPRHPCFNAGDERNNVQPGLTALHTIFLRQHNQIALALSQINNFWTDDQLFQESRRILIAKLQHVVYNEWLPVVLGCEVMARYDLTPRKTGYYAGYDSTCDASISQELATAALRFGHTLIRNVFPRMNASFEQDWAGMELEHNFNNATTLYDERTGHMESLLMGLLGAPGMDYDRFIVAAVRNHLFQKPGGPLTGLDLPAVNIQRGRDHGIPSYNSYRPMCGLQSASSFDDLLDTMDESAVFALRSVYAHVDDIDLFPGIMSERPLKGALVGPMLACILAEQFQRLKRCDRFYYEHNDPAIRFSPGQLAEIRKTTLSRMVCESSDYAQHIQPNAFLLPDELTNAPIKCSELPAMDLYEWLDRQFCVVDQRVINLGKTRRITPCVTCTCTAEGPECHSITVERCDDLFEDYLFNEIKKDTVCVIQCARAIGEREKAQRERG